MRNIKIRSQFVKSMTLSDVGTDRVPGLVAKRQVMGAPVNSNGSISRSAALLATLISTKSTRLQIPPWNKDGHPQLANITNRLSTMGSAMRSDQQSGKSLAPIANEHRVVGLAMNSEFVDSATVNLKMEFGVENTTAANITTILCRDELTTLSAHQVELVKRTVPLRVGWVPRGLAATALEVTDSPIKSASTDQQLPTTCLSPLLSIAEHPT